MPKWSSPSAAREPRPVPHLTADERALYLDLVHPSWARKRRVEQERIPLPMARATVVAASGD
ncbi:Wadjet anti-phage system protein JetD domain-containing protein [Microterricola viridarii]|uniref:Wadjet anti-phage system protein JetD domain-containing protein n=1 Tax=Microterricola viridarii TaxID=412690 RepID=UPI0009F25FBF